MNKTSYIEKTHFYGRLATILVMIVMLAIPTTICTVYNVWPSPADIFATAGPLLALFVPTALSEVISFTPMTGTSGYIAAITGNVSNIKFPCALNAMEITNSLPGTEKGDVMAMSAMCISGMVTMVIIAIGVVLLVPLKPILTTPTVITATKYLMPALFGSMATSVLMSKNAGEYMIEGKVKIAAVPIILIFIIQLFLINLTRFQGFVLLAMIPVTILVAKIMYNKGIVKVIERPKNVNKQKSKKAYNKSMEEM